MNTLYDIYNGIWSQAFGAQYVADHPDLLALLATVSVVGTLYWFVRLLGKLVQKWTHGRGD